MTLRPSTTSLLALLTAVALAGCSSGADQGAYPAPFEANLLVISLDTTRADHLSCYGYSRPTSPFLERLAADGHRFDEAYAVMPTTLPSHTSMFTSLYPSQLGVSANGYPVPAGADTLAERLGRSGFATGAFVSASPLHPRLGLNQGFDVYDAPAAPDVPAGQTRRRVSAWLRERKSERFFCFVHLFDPHTWYDPPNDLRDVFGVPPGVGPPERGFLSKPFGPELCKASVDAYDAEIRSADREIEALLGTLEELGLRERTIVVFTADHGETLDELLARFQYAFDHGEYLSRRELRVPLLFWLPPSFPGRGPAVHPQPVSLVDLMPTVLDLLGVECAPPFVGRSLAPLLLGEPVEERPVVSERRHLNTDDHPSIAGDEFSVVAGRWHWIHSDARPDELYELGSAAGPEVDVIAAHPDRAGALAEALADWRRRCGTPLFDATGRELDPELREQLEALGYTTGDDEE